MAAPPSSSQFQPRRHPHLAVQIQGSRPRVGSARIYGGPIPSYARRTSGGANGGPAELTQVDDGTDYGRMGVSDGDDDLGGRIQPGTAPLLLPMNESTHSPSRLGCNFRFSVRPPSLAHAASSTRRAMAAAG
ncbi:LOW QUALITY PROTEIN: hypothetical protein SETIT_8G070100v2 [Setaria italica]|uniref:Uncharacterized protein n=1 Tax=Setaria italica TaxID=4555 RepID=A0A368S5A3_SETIT|nr:LOW QUALITY PROTEIN: hypothetical protein SETIT_8G070100v2 [Setaria italica]